MMQVILINITGVATLVSQPAGHKTYINFILYNFPLFTARNSLKYSEVFKFEKLVTNAQG